MTNTESKQLREEIEKHFTDHGLEYKCRQMLLDSILSIFQSHESQIKQDIFKKVEGIIGEDESGYTNQLGYHEGQSAGQETRNELRQELRSSLKALEEKEIG